MPGSWKRAAAQELGMKPASHTTGERGRGTKLVARAAAALQHKACPLSQTKSKRLRGTQAFYTPLGAARGLEGDRSNPQCPRKGNASMWSRHSFPVPQGTLPEACPLIFCFGGSGETQELLYVTSSQVGSVASQNTVWQK